MKHTLQHSLADLWRYHERRFPIAQQIGHGLQNQQREWVGERFREFIPYQSGMNLRQVHWPSFLKSRELLIKTYDQQQFGEICFLIDQSASCQLKNQGQSQSKFQFMIQMILAICASAIASAHQCRIFYLNPENHQLQQMLVFHLPSWKQLAQILLNLQEHLMPSPWASWQQAIAMINPKSKLLLWSDFFDFPLATWQSHRDLLPLQLCSNTDKIIEIDECYDDFEREGLEIAFVQSQTNQVQFLQDFESYQDQLKIYFQKMRNPILPLSIETSLNVHYEQIISKLTLSMHKI
jgi:hypothetical protein